jgi:WHG domain-containing protein
VSPAPAGAQAALTAGRRHADLLRAVLRDYDLTGDRAVHAVRLLGSVVQGFTTLDLADAFAHSQPPSQESRRYIVDALDAMLRADGAAHAGRRG